MDDGAVASCRACGERYPRIGGVYRFTGADHYTKAFGFQWNRFSRTQLDSASGTTRSRDAFVEKTGWPLSELRGQRVLDAGCGMGRFTEIAADAGAEVHAVDLSTAVVAAYRNLGHRDNIRFYQADIMNLPFDDDSFDRVFSIGVLHHTPSTRSAFLRLCSLVRPGGSIAIWVYTSEPAPPLASRLLRRITTRLPERLLLSLCRVAVPLYHLHRVPHLGNCTARLLPVGMDVDPEWRWLSTFDWYAPRYQWTHSWQEVLGWFRVAGLEQIERGAFPVSVRARKPARDRSPSGEAGRR